jgi:hypothetical protein
MNCTASEILWENEMGGLRSMHWGEGTLRVVAEKPERQTPLGTPKR